jgi:hypothetical protein
LNTVIAAFEKGIAKAAAKAISDAALMKRNLHMALSKAALNQL